MAPSLVTDTHSIVWYLARHDAISPRAFAAIDTALIEGVPVYVSAISLVELTYLVEKGSVQQAALEDLMTALNDADNSLTLMVLDMAVSKALGTVSREAVPDMPDRVITATAMSLGLPLVTKDGNIRASNAVETIW